MKKQILFGFLFCILTIVNTSSAQSRWSPLLEGANSPGSALQTSDGGYIVETTSGSFGLQNPWIVKLSSSGAMTWQKAFGDNTNCSSVNAIQTTSDNGYVFAGFLTIPCGSPDANFWVVKLDSAGNIQWQKSYGGSSTEVAYTIQQTSDQGYIVAGSTASFSSFPGDYHIWVIKLDASGNIVWEKSYGGDEDEEAKSVQQTSDGGYVLTGFTVSYGAGDEDIFVLKLDSSGNVQWMKTYGDSNFSTTDEPRKIKQTSDGGYILTSFSDANFWVLKLDASGNTDWQKRYGYGDGTSLQQTSDGGYIVAGTNREVQGGDAWLLRLDPNGDIRWQRRYGGDQNDSFNSIQETADGGFIASGISGSFGTGFNDFWIVKLNCGGSIDPSCNCTHDVSATATNISAIITSPSPEVIVTAATVVNTTQSSVDTNANQTQHCSSPTCVFCENFQDGMLAANWLYTPDISLWSENGGELVSPNVKRSSAIADPALAACGANCTVEAVLRNSGGQNTISLFGWYVDKNNNVELLMKAGRQKVLLRQRVNKTVVVKEKADLFVETNVDYVVRISFDGVNFQAYVNDVLMITMPAFVTPATAPPAVQAKKTSGSFCEASQW